MWAQQDHLPPQHTHTHIHIFSHDLCRSSEVVSAVTCRFMIREAIICRITTASTQKDDSVSIQVEVAGSCQFFSRLAFRSRSDILSFHLISSSFPVYFVGFTLSCQVFLCTSCLCLVPICFLCALVFHLWISSRLFKSVCFPSPSSALFYFSTPSVFPAVSLSKSSLKLFKHAPAHQNVLTVSSHTHKTYSSVLSLVQELSE